MKYSTKGSELGNSTSTDYVNCVQNRKTIIKIHV